MKILFVSESIWTKGVVYDLHILAEGLARLGHEVYAFGPGGEYDQIDGQSTSCYQSRVSRVFSDGPVYLNSPCFNPLFLGQISIEKVPGVKFIQKNVRRYQELKKIFKTVKIDVVVLYSAARVGVQAVHLAKKYKVPIVFRNVDILHNLWPTRFQRFMVKKAERYVYPRVKQLMALTPKYGEYLVRLGAKKENTHLLVFPIDTRSFHPGADCSKIREVWKIKNTDQVIVFVGTLYEFSGMAEFVEQFSQVLSQVPNVKLLIVGDGPLRPKLEKIINHLKLENHVIITGYQPFSDMPQYINTATVCLNVFPINEATKDIFSAKIVQYLACGKATVSTALPGITTLIPGESGGVIYSDTVLGLNQALIRLLSSSRERKKIEEAGLRYIEKNHCCTRVIKRFENMLGKIVGITNQQDLIQPETILVV